MKQIFNEKAILVKGSTFVFGSLFYNCFVNRNLQLSGLDYVTYRQVEALNLAGGRNFLWKARNPSCSRDPDNLMRYACSNWQSRENLNS